MTTDGARPFGQGEFRASSGAGRKRNRWTVAFWPYEHNGSENPVPVFWRLVDARGNDRTWATREGAQKALDRLNLPYEIALFWHRRAVEARRWEREYPGRFTAVCAQQADPFGLYIEKGTDNGYGNLQHYRPLYRRYSVRGGD